MAINPSLTIYYIDDIGASGINIETSGRPNRSYEDQVLNTRKDTTRKYASLDGSWDLDGSYGFAPSTKALGELGWWGNELSGVGGVFTNTQFIQVNMTGSDFNKVLVAGDNKRMEYPVDFNYIVYLNNDEVFRSEVRGNTEVIYEDSIAEVVPLYDAVRLEVLKWSHESRQVKIIEIIEKSIESYDGEAIMSVDLLEESAYVSSALPIGKATSNEISIVMFNKDRMFDVNNPFSPIVGLMKENRLLEMTLQADGIDYPLGKFWTKEWDVSEGDVQVRVTGYDIITRMGETIYFNNQVRTNVSYTDILEDIFEDFGIPPNRYIIDSELNNYMIDYSYIDIMSHRQALELVLDACGGNAYIDRNGLLIVNSLKEWEVDGVSKLEINGDNSFSKDIIIKDELVNTVVVDQLNISPKAASEEVINVEVTVESDALVFEEDIKFNSLPAISVSTNIVSNTSGAVIDNIQTFSWGIRVRVVSSNAGSFTIVATGTTFESKKVSPVTKRANVVQVEKLYRASNNHLRQRRSMCELYANGIISAFNKDIKYIDAKIRGSLEVNVDDFIEGYTWRNEPVTLTKFKVLKQTINFDGTLEATIKGRSL